jgi:hypothetical protein
MIKQTTELNGNDFTGFKLISIELKNDKLFGDIKYNFIDKKDKQDKIYTTVLIGQNGTRKSRLFQRVINLLWSLQDLKEKQVLFSEQFCLKYSLNNSIYEFSNMHAEDQGDSKFGIISLQLKIDGKKQENFKKADLPSSIIANAIMLTDRFPFPDQERFPRYQYLGSRYRPQLASTKTFIGRVVEFVSKNINSESFISGVRKIAIEFLPKESEPCISYYTQNTPRFFKGKMKSEEFYSYYEEIEKKYKDKTTAPPFKLNHYKNIIKDPKLAKQIVDYCNELKEGGEMREFSKKTFKAITFNLLDEKDVAKLRERYVLLDHMRQLGIVYPADIEFLKKVKAVDGKTHLEGYSIVESSSGEHNLLGSMIGLIASIQPNSLIFIDEPEISLHPNWQMKYLTFLRELLSSKEYATCHIIVATHSHFLISDLDGKNSAVVALTRDAETKKLSANLLEGTDTYGWSAEDVLYNVFQVTTTRNYFVALEIGEILKLVAKKDIDFVTLNSKKGELEKIKSALKPTDPLKSLIEKVQKEFLHV